MQRGFSLPLIGFLITLAIIAYLLTQKQTDQPEILVQPEQSSNTEFSKKEKCEEVGAKVYQEYKKEYESMDYYVGTPKFAFNKMLNTCLSALDWSKFDKPLGSSSNTYHYRSVVLDSFTRKEILTFEREDLKVIICHDSISGNKCESEIDFLSIETSLME